jgi:hypothetical protein
MEKARTGSATVCTVSMYLLTFRLIKTDHQRLQLSFHKPSYAMMNETSPLMPVTDETSVTMLDAFSNDSMMKDTCTAVVSFTDDDSLIPPRRGHPFRRTRRSLRNKCANPQRKRENPKNEARLFVAPASAFCIQCMLMR